MPIHVSWGDDQKTYTFFRFESKWTWDEYHQSIEAASRLTQNSPHMVNVLVDITECHVFPQNLLSNVRSAVMQHAHETDLVVIVTTSRFVEMLLRTLEKLRDKESPRLRPARTLPEGQQILADYTRQHPLRPRVPTAASESAPAPAEPISPLE